MSFLGSLKDFFLPSEAVSAERRKDVFGTESKAVAGAVIIGSAAALIAAPVLVTRAGGSQAVLKAAGTKLANTSLATRVGVGVLGAPAVVAIASNPKVATRAAGGYVNLETNLIEVAKDPSIQGVKDVFVENPVIASGLAALGLVALGGAGAAVGTISNAINTAATRENTDAILGGRDIPNVPSPSGALPDTAMSTQYLPQGGATEGPLTPETQVLGTEVRSGAVRARRRARARPERPLRVYNRVNILNQQVS